MNVHESYGRARKVAALVRAIDSELREHGRGHEAPDSVAKFLRGQSDGFWAVLSKRHGIRKPSAITVAAVVLEYECRAETDQGEIEPDANALADLARDDFFDELAEVYR